MNSTYDRALYLLRKAFGVKSEKSINKLLAGDLTLDDLASRLQRALLDEGFFVAVDRETVRGVIQTNTGGGVNDDVLDEFIDDHYDDECGAAQDELRDTIGSWVEGDESGAEND